MIRPVRSRDQRLAWLVGRGGSSRAASLALSKGEGNIGLLLEQQATAQADVERLGGWDREHNVLAFMNHLSINRPDAKISSLSGGEQRRVALARVLISSPDLAILDEPTNHLDAETIEWLEEYLIDEYKNAILLITHDRYLLDRVAQRTVEVANGEVYSYDGGYQLYLEQKAERLAHMERTESNRQNFLRKELEWLSRQPKARSTKQKARIDRAETAKAVTGPKLDRTATLELDVVRSGKTILELRDLRVEIGGRTLIHDLSLFLTEGERIGIVGPNGSGKTTLLKTLLGELKPALRVASCWARTPKLRTSINAARAWTIPNPSSTTWPATNRRSSSAARSSNVARTWSASPSTRTSNARSWFTVGWRTGARGPGAAAPAKRQFGDFGRTHQ